MQSSTNFEELELNKISLFCWTQNITMSCFMLFLVSGIVSYAYNLQDLTTLKSIVIALSPFTPITETVRQKCPRLIILIRLELRKVIKLALTHWP